MDAIHRIRTACRHSLHTAVLDRCWPWAPRALTKTLQWYFRTVVYDLKEVESY